MLRGFNPITLLFAFFFAVAFQALPAQSDTWAVSLGSAVQDYPEDVLVDDQCNTYVTGFFRDTLHYGTDSAAAAGQTDFFVAKYDCNGALTWQRRYGWFENEFSRALAFDTNGNIIVVADYQDSTIVSNDTIFSLDTLWYGPYSGTYDILMLLLDPNGTLLDFKADGWFGSENFYDVAVDSRNFKIFSGMFRTYNFFGGGLWGRGYDDAFLVVMDTANEFIWKEVASGKYIDKANAVGIIGDSLYVMGGIFQDTCYFRDSTVYEVTNFEDDVFVSMWDSSRQFHWALTGGGPGKDYLDALETDAQGNIYICGRYDTSFTMGGQTIFSEGNLDGFIAKISQTGSLLWLKSIGGKYFDSATDLIISNNGKILVTGYFQGEADFDGTIVSGVDSLDQDVFVAAYDGNGALIWVRRAGGSSLDKGTAIDVDAQGFITVTGVFSGEAWFGQKKLTSRGSEDIFVMRMRSDGSVDAESATEIAQTGVRVFPNPTAANLNVVLDAGKQDRVNLTVFDVQGKIVQGLNSEVNIRPGVNNFELETQSLASGMYILKIIGTHTQQAVRFAVSE